MNLVPDRQVKTHRPLVATPSPIHANKKSESTATIRLATTAASRKMFNLAVVVGFGSSDLSFVVTFASSRHLRRVDVYSAIRAQSLSSRAAFPRRGYAVKAST